MIKIKLQKKLFNKPLIIILFVIALMVSGVFIYINRTDATVSGWMAGRIIDDNVFTDRSSMSAAQIQTFLNNQVPNCDTNGTQPASEFGRPDLTHAQYAAMRGWQAPPYVCIKNYTKNGKTAAQLIYDTAQKYNISPKVLIVLLQKEQSLITDTWPLNVPQYRSATGYGCPDTAPCDAEYYGLENQLDWAGHMYNSIMTNSPTWYTPYELGNNYIQYNPTSSCGGSTVYIQNRATQALYNYTPYQPNSATLDANWGATVSCGAYGNLNFYRYYTKWFGATTSAATYSYSVVSTSFYSDYTYENTIPNTSSIEKESSFWVQVVIRNTGNQSWYGDNLHLATANPNDRTSAFSTIGGTGGWLNPIRPASMSEDYVGGGETATFRFGMQAPIHLGDYQESFGVVIEGYRWLSNTFTVPITVTSANPYYSTQTISFDTYSDSAMTKKINPSNISKYTDSNIYIKTIIKNTGNQTLPADLTKIATTNPLDRSSVFQNDSWLSQNRAAASQGGDILPQETGTFEFSMTTPSTPLAATSEQFGLVIEKQQWLSTNIGTISIDTAQRPPSSLESSQSITVNNKLISKDEAYKLVLQADGNLVIYSTKRAIWSSRTTGLDASILIMQADGNLVLYNSKSRPIWSSRTYGNPGSKLIMQNDGNLVIYNSSGRAIWSSHTYKVI